MARIELVAPNSDSLNGAINGERLSEVPPMSKRLPANLDEQLLAHIGNATNGAGIDDLLHLMSREISRRSLQRRLSDLVVAGRLITEGRGRSTRYFRPQVIAEAVAEDA